MLRYLLILFACTLLFVGCQQTQNRSSEIKPATKSNLPKNADIDLQQIRSGIWLHTSHYTYPGGARYSSNGLIVREGDSLLLIDTAWGEVATTELLRQIESKIGLPVFRSIITHSHYDRVAGVDMLESKGIEVLAHPMTQELIAKQGGPVPNDTLTGLGEPGTSVTVGMVEVLFPGSAHTPDNLMVWLPKQQVLFGGCAIRATDAESLGNVAHANLVSWPKAVRHAQVRYSQAEVVVPGHGEIGGSGLLNHTLELLENEN